MIGRAASASQTAAFKNHLSLPSVLRLVGLMWRFASCRLDVEEGLFCRRFVLPVNLLRDVTREAVRVRIRPQADNVLRRPNEKRLSKLSAGCNIVDASLGDFGSLPDMRARIGISPASSLICDFKNAETDRCLSLWAEERASLLPTTNLRSGTFCQIS
jgi:hypothetical protein